MTDSTGNGDNKVVEFPTTAEERRALHKAKQDIERQRLIHCFVDEAGVDQALFHTHDGAAYADLIVEGVRQTWPIRSKQFRFEYVRFLRRQFEALTDKGAVLALALGPSLKKSAVNAAIDEFETRAICSRSTREVHVRIAADGDDIYIDLADADWHAVRVTAAGWSIVQSPPVRFRHSNGMQPLPFPARGMSIDQLRPFLNINANDFVLMVAYLLAALRPGGPYPVLALIGEHGAAKTTLMRVLRSLIDPSTVPDEFIAVQRSRSVHRRSQLARSGVRKRLETPQRDVRLFMPSRDRWWDSHARAVQGYR